ncbi:phosphatase PAP2 family protein [Actinomadura luzonensis]|nr:phosphatase PAP2 family protein [Actinomadura luzonensis]
MMAIIGLLSDISWRIPAGCLPAAASVLATAWIGGRPGAGRKAALLRYAAPLLVLPVAYDAAARAALVVHGGYLDADVRAFEHAVFGFSPNAAANAFATAPLTEFLTFCYFLFYGAFLLPLILRARGRAALAERYLFATLLTLLICYAGFMTLPLAGPLTGAVQRPGGYLVTAVQTEIMAALDPPGTCFPSPHVAGAWITLLTLRRHAAPAARLALWVLTLGLTVAVVYDGYHYVTDAVAGLAVALAVHALTTRRGTPRPAPPWARSPARAPRRPARTSTPGDAAREPCPD